MRPKGRRPKYRIVNKEPKISQFSPRGKAGRPDEVELKMDQFEAIRLADFEHLSQTESAKSMHISQQTFSRILKKARQTIADGLIQGKIIRVQGGYYVIKNQRNPQQNSAPKAS